MEIIRLPHKFLFHHSAHQTFEYFGISPHFQEDLQWKLTEKHRFYHNYEHINHIIDMIDKYDASKYNYNLSSIDKQILLATALYHDAIYNPQFKNNEEQSIKYFISHCSQNLNRTNEIEQVISLIRDTIKHTPSSKLSEIFCDFDLQILKEGNFQDMLIMEKKIFLEFQKYDYTLYKKGRIEFLESFLKNVVTNNTENIRALIDYIKIRVPKIGIYAGSFNPFHKGHLNIVEKAEKIFDKVIIAKGINPEKPTDKGLNGLDDKLYYRQVEEFKGVITDYIPKKSQDADITLIRGLRNGNDLSYEINQLTFIKEFDSNLKYVFIHCDKEYEHISSTAMRSMLASGDEKMIAKAKYYCEI